MNENGFQSASKFQVRKERSTFTAAVEIKFASLKAGEVFFSSQKHGDKGTFSKLSKLYNSVFFHCKILPEPSTSIAAKKTGLKFNSFKTFKRSFLKSNFLN